MERQNVVSREYKVMLRAGRFDGDAGAVRKAAAAFWHDLSASVDDLIALEAGSLQRVESRRLIEFFDTRDRRLNGAGYIFRQRRELGDGTREVTLKFRHPDRHLAAGRVMAAAGTRKQRTKFEEDIKAPFVSLYSFSTTVEVGDRARFETLRDVARLFPDLGRQLGKRSLDAPVEVVRGFTAREIVLGGASMTLARKPKTKAESGLIVWYDAAGRKDRPCAVEFSFRYGNRKEAYDARISGAAYEVFRRLQALEWVDPQPRTKTAFVFA
jgi:hypothetical protein